MFDLRHLSLHGRFVFDKFQLCCHTCVYETVIKELEIEVVSYSSQQGCEEINLKGKYQRGEKG